MTGTDEDTTTHADRTERTDRDPAGDHAVDHDSVTARVVDPDSVTMRVLEREPAMVGG